MVESKQKNNGFNSAAIAVAGAVVGLGIAAAGLALRKEKTREKIKESLGDAKDHMVKLMDDKSKDVKYTVNKIEEEQDKAKVKLKKIVDVSKES